MIDSTALVAIIAVLGTVVGIAGTCVGLMVWLIKRSDKRQDSTIQRNSTAIEKNNAAYQALAESLNNSTAASRSLEESIRKRDQQDREFQSHVLEGFETQSKLLEKISAKSDRILKAIPVKGEES
ncbi:hypothetical protein [Glutamicibacter halophytocola]|uniref:hypothetical protein n=1 Tax=Glutamicibacter halophytocola TaxID=1933880 RepID=UPI0015C54277|nr:hypothetical protein [Glutamicibacter halophytocola]NQD39955.1 hypothetical protein [Glutamicibacter halophytocola]